jgi:hypothetical protein
VYKATSIGIHNSQNTLEVNFTLLNTIKN